MVPARTAAVEVQFGAGGHPEIAQADLGRRFLTLGDRIARHRDRMLDEPPLDVLLSLHPAPIQDVAQRLRAIVHRTIPDALEVVDGLQPVRRGQRLIGYRIPLDRKRAPYFAWILAEQVHAHLGFTYGALLADPDGVLEGREFRRVRFVTFRTPADIVDPARLERFLLAAVEVASLTRGQRMARFVEGGAGLRPGT